MWTGIFSHQKEICAFPGKWQFVGVQVNRLTVLQVLPCHFLSRSLSTDAHAVVANNILSCFLGFLKAISRVNLENGPILPWIRYTWSSTSRSAISSARRLETIEKPVNG